jgi:hypothetical protein
MVSFVMSMLAGEVEAVFGRWRPPIEEHANCCGLRAKDCFDHGFGAVHVDVHGAGEEMCALGRASDRIDVGLRVAVPVEHRAVVVTAGDAAKPVERGDALAVEIEIERAWVQQIGRAGRVDPDSRARAAAIVALTASRLVCSQSR